MKKSTIPNISTFANLSFGIISLLFMMNKSFTGAAICILCGALIDRYDVKIARFLNVSSDLGKELDSLADLVSFGATYNYRWVYLSFISYTRTIYFNTIYPNNSYNSIIRSVKNKFR